MTAGLRFESKRFALLSNRQSHRKFLTTSVKENFISERCVLDEKRSSQRIMCLSSLPGFQRYHIAAAILRSKEMASHSQVTKIVVSSTVMHDCSLTTTVSVWDNDSTLPVFGEMRWNGTPRRRDERS